MTMEFDLIHAIRAGTQSARGDVALGIGDDAALLDVRGDRQLVACTDSMVEGVHFLAGTAPGDLGWKSLAVNLSDLAAMGAEPAWALLALTLPDADDDFVGRFADGFAELASAHRVALVGGDTTEGPLAITVTALGMVPRGQALARTGARAGDGVFVTGTLGDAAGALRMLRDSGHGVGVWDSPNFPPHPLPSPPPSPSATRSAYGRLSRERERGSDRRAARDSIIERSGREGNARSRAARDAALNEAGARDPEQRVEASWSGLLQRMCRPQPRIAAGLALRGVASACIDVSDGLLADLGHVCAASGVGAEIEADALPVSAALRGVFDAASCREFALSGGDDYELCFTTPDGRAAEIVATLAGIGCAATRIGHITGGSGVRVVDAQGTTVESRHAGWEHFSR